MRLPPAPVSLESPPSLQAALRLLLQARTTAAELQLDRWDFAVEIQALAPAGISHTDLRVLMCHGYVDHAVECTTTGSDRRTFCRGGKLCLNEATCFVLTEKGLAVVEEAAPKIANGHLAPRWDAGLRELRVEGQLVKRFRVPAPNQELILSAFEEEGWPAHLDDPLPPRPEMEPKRRLHDAIHCLNRNQQMQLVRFSGDGKGRGLRWRRLPA